MADSKAERSSTDVAVTHTSFVPMPTDAVAIHRVAVELGDGAVCDPPHPRVTVDRHAVNVIL